MMKLDEKVKVKLPKAKGMRVVGIEPKFPLENLVDSDGKNEVRFSGTCDKAVGKLMNIIDDGNYEPEYHVPPTVEMVDGNKGELITGFHRLRAHEGVDAETMHVAIVEFFEEEGMSANFWRIQWKLNENKEDENYVKTNRTPQDIVGTIVNLIHDKEITSSTQDIEFALKQSGLSRGKVVEYTSQVFSNLGHSTKVVDSVKKTDLSKIATKYGHENNTKTIAATFSDIKDFLYDRRAVAKWMQAIMNGHEEPRIVARVTNANQTDLVEIREKKEDELNAIVDDMGKFFDFCKDNNIKPKIKVVWTGQLHDEKKNEVV